MLKKEGIQFKTILKSALVLISVVIGLIISQGAQAAINQSISFRGKITDTGGTAVADGTYNLSFSLYTAATGGSAIWSEDLTAANRFSAAISGSSSGTGTITYTYTGDANESALMLGQYLTNADNSQASLIADYDTSANTITVTNEYTTWANGANINNRPRVKGSILDEPLGSVTSLANINFNQPLYLEVIFNSETMRPRKLIAAAAQAMNADKLDNYDSSEFAVTSDNRSVTGYWDIMNVFAIATSSATSTALTVTQSGAGDIVNIFDGGTEVFTILDGGNIGIASSSPWANLSVNQDDGQIAFAVGSSTATSFIIDQNGYIGIGTSTPTASLSTAGLMYIGGTGTSTIENNLTILGALKIGASSLYLNSNSITNLSGSLVLQPNGGYVGLGTSTPWANLSVEQTDGQIAFAVGSSTATSFIIDQNGRVGIGATDLTGSKFKIVAENNSVSDNYNDQSKIASLGNNTLSAGKLQLVEAVCGSYTVQGSGSDSGTIYGTVLGEDGECWLNKNLGATSAATSYNDYQSYGSLYQWGRGSDGHQLITWTSATVGTPVNGNTNATSTTAQPAHALFITNITPGLYDWLTPQDNTLWNSVSSTNNPCPAGWRLPTSAEWHALALLIPAGAGNFHDCTTNCREAAASSNLKIPSAGTRDYSGGALYYQSSVGSYWSSGPYGAYAYYLYFYSTSVSPAYYYNRAYGFSVRCVKD